MGKAELTKFILGMHQFCQSVSAVTFKKATAGLNMSLVWKRKMEAKGLHLVSYL